MNKQQSVFGRTGVVLCVLLSVVGVSLGFVLAGCGLGGGGGNNGGGKGTGFRVGGLAWDVVPENWKVVEGGKGEDRAELRVWDQRTRGVADGVRDDPNSLMGRSVETARNAVRAHEERQNEAIDIANDISGGSEPTITMWAVSSGTEDGAETGLLRFAEGQVARTEGSYNGVGVRELRFVRDDGRSVQGAVFWTEDARVVAVEFAGPRDVIEQNQDEWVAFVESVRVDESW